MLGVKILSTMALAVRIERRRMGADPVISAVRCKIAFTPETDIHKR